MPEYIVCHLCGRNRIKASKIKGSLRWDYADLITSPFLQVREGIGPGASPKKRKGRGAPGQGFPTVETRTLIEIRDNPEYQTIIQGYRDQIVKIAKQAIKIGLISKDEL